MSVLEKCRINDVIGVRYGDNPKERVCRVLDVRDTVQHPLASSTLLKRKIPRGRFLVTCQSTDGQIRSFYSGVEETARNIPRIRAALLAVCGKLPKRRKV